MGHNSMPKGLSMLGRGSDLRISVVLDDMVTVECAARWYVCSDDGGDAMPGRYAWSSVVSENMYLQRDWAGKKTLPLSTKSISKEAKQKTNW